MAKGDKTRPARMPIVFAYSGQFKKDWERLAGTGRYNMSELKRIMMMLIAGEQLPSSNRDHPLADSKDFKGYRECHIGGDFLLVYKMLDGVLIFSRSGTHSELFGK